MTRSATSGLVADAVDGHMTRHPQPVLDTFMPALPPTTDPTSPASVHRPREFRNDGSNHRQRQFSDDTSFNSYNNSYGNDDNDEDDDGDEGLVMQKRRTNIPRSRPALSRGVSEVSQEHLSMREIMRASMGVEIRMRHGWEAQLESPAQAERLSSNFFMYFEDKRHETAGNPPPQFEPKTIVTEWRMKDRLKTISAVLAVCLNVGVDPPDVIKTNPCARMECWIDPIPPEGGNPNPTSGSNAAIGKNLQAQYENLSLRTRYRVVMDPTSDELRRYTQQLRRNAHHERILFHYNGHGVPKPTPGGEVWCFNRSYTQYIPMNLYDLQEWVGAPGLWVWDCSASGGVIKGFLDAAAKHTEAQEEALKRDPNKIQQQPLTKWEDCIHLAACRQDEVLPTNPELPADLFTSCLTTPIPTAVRFFILQNPLRSTFGVTLQQAQVIPGKVSERRTPLGELNWIFTAITDTIAWNCLDQALFKKLFRQDLMVAALFRNFLLAQRVMRMFHCHPQSHPQVPDTHNHPLWQSWDLAVEMILAQLPSLLAQQEASDPLEEPNGPNASGPPQPPQPTPELDYRHSDFFADQLSAFQVYLDSAPAAQGASGPIRHPEQLPIVLQVLLSQVHRLRALVLLSRFLDLGPWAVNLALSIGIFPYVLKLLQSQAFELKPPMIFIWARILAVDQSCQGDLLKDQGYMYFASILHSATGMPPDNVAEHRAMCAFIIAMFCKDFKPGKLAVLESNPEIMENCLEHLLDMKNPLLRQFSCLCLSNLWRDCPPAKAMALAHQAHARVRDRSHDPVPEVRAACLDALTAFVATGDVDAAVALEEETLASVVISMGMDGSIMVRKELTIFYSTFIKKYENKFVVAAWEQMLEEHKQDFGHDESHGLSRSTGLGSMMGTARSSNGTASPMASAETIVAPNGHHRAVSFAGTSELSSSNGTNGRAPAQSLSARTIYRAMWRQILSMSADPHPEVARNASIVVDYVVKALMESELGEYVTEIVEERMAHVSKKDQTETSALDQLSRQRSRDLNCVTPPSPSASTASKADGYFSTFSRNASFAVGLKNLIGNWGPRTPLVENPPSPIKPRPQLPSDRQRPTTPRDTAQLPPDALDNISGPAHQPLAMLPLPPHYVPRTLSQAPTLPLPSNFFTWSASYFREPQMRPSESDEPGSLDYNERLWRRNRNDRIIAMTQPLKDSAGSRAWDTSMGHFGIGAAPHKMSFHQFENHLVTADDRDSIAIWDWEARTQLTRFSNGNPLGSRVTELRFINEDDQAMLMTGSSDGVIKIFRYYDDPDRVQMASSFRALSDLVVSDKQNAGLVFDWQQGQGRILVAGDDRVIRVWQAGHEMCISDIPARSGSCITSLTSDQVEGNVFVAGFGNGAIRAYDQRLPPRESMVMDWTDRTKHHKSWVVGCHLQRGGLRELISAESSGSIRLWDLRHRGPVSSFDHKRQSEPRSLRALSVHEHAPVFATGGADNRVRVFNTSCKRLSSFEPPHLGVLPFARGSRAAPITATAFHPHQMMLACGAANDGHVSLYRCEAVPDYEKALAALDAFEQRRETLRERA